MPELEVIRMKYALLRPVMDERMRRLWAAAEAQVVGRGGITLVARATEISRRTIAAGLRELAPGARGPIGRASCRERV